MWKQKPQWAWKTRKPHQTINHTIQLTTEHYQMIPLKYKFLAGRHPEEYKDFIHEWIDKEIASSIKDNNLVSIEESVEPDGYHTYTGTLYVGRKIY